MVPADAPEERAATLIERCRARGVRLAVAESCTGGLIAAALTEIAGASDVFDRGFVVYDNRAKTELLGVPADLIEREGAVSEPVVRAMAEGALAAAPVALAVAVTGIAGPAGGSPDKPVGLVHIAAAMRGRPTLHRRHRFTGDRGAVRAASVIAALDLLLEQLR
jgi:nicotinamide-nucleotide amidase